MCFTILQRTDARLQDRFRAGEIGFADPQRNHVFHSGGNIKKFANT